MQREVCDELVLVLLRVEVEHLVVLVVFEGRPYRGERVVLRDVVPVEQQLLVSVLVVLLDLHVDVSLLKLGFGTKSEGMNRTRMRNGPVAWVARVKSVAPSAVTDYEGVGVLLDYLLELFLPLVDELIEGNLPDESVFFVQERLEDIAVLLEQSHHLGIEELR